MEKPIGYWIKLLDQLIEAVLDSTLEHHGMNRRQWQILNLAKSEPTTMEDIVDQLEEFFDAESAATVQIDELIESGLLEHVGGRIQLTTTGHERLFRARQDVAATRSLVGAGVSPEDYETTVGTLVSMCRNLGWNPR